jgi:putative membrane protein
MVDAREWLGVYLRGVAMGCADAVPGVSGGTIALITGIYERLIAAITAVDPDRIRRVLAGAKPANLPDARAAFLELDGPFLCVLGAGIATAIVTVLRIVEHLLEAAPVATFGFFFGLIAASAVVLRSEVDLSTPGRKAAAVVGFLAAFLTSGYAESVFGGGLGVVFVAGAIAVSAMVLPGISGSLLLVILGQYERMTDALSAFIDGIVSAVAAGDPDPAIAAAPPVVVFLAGGVVGLFTVAHAVRRALERRRAATVAFLVSLIVGALRAPVVEVDRTLAATGGSWNAAAPEFLGVAAVGAAVVLVLDRYSGAIEY